MPETEPVNWAIALHGGADATPSRNYAHVKTHMTALLKTVSAKLEAGESALDVAEFAVAELEACGHHIAGKGASPNQNGVWELDAAIMHGPDRKAGAVCALVGFKSPVKVARSVMAGIPVLLSGKGAADFAAAHDHERVPDPHAYYEPSVKEAPPPNTAGHGTVGAVVRDRHGALVAATSTGGLLNKTPGRVGDSPIIGSGTWADENTAISCTGEGEYFMRTAAAASVAARIRYGGQTLEEAVEAVISEVGTLGGKGGLISVDRHGHIALPYNSSGLKRASATSAGHFKVKVFD